MQQFHMLKICKFHLQGHCRLGHKCKYSHDVVRCDLMRHAESTYNHELATCPFNANSEQAKTEFQMNEELIDAGLTQQGVKQIKEVKYGDRVYDMVFVSPLERCLTTADRTIKEHQIRSKKVVVLPGLTEVLSKICDFGLSVDYKMQKYPHFDFSYMKADKQSASWQDKLVDSQFKYKIDKGEQYSRRYLKVLDHAFPQPLENSQRCFKRVIETLNQIKNICQQEKARKILIVSHNRIIKYVIGRDRQGRAQSIGNCEVKSTFI